MPIYIDNHAFYIPGMRNVRVMGNTEVWVNGVRVKNVSEALGELAADTRQTRPVKVKIAGATLGTLKLSRCRLAGGISVSKCRIRSVETTTGSVHVNGNVDGHVETTTGSVRVNNDVGGYVKTTNGPVTCKNVGGDVNTTNGSIHYTKAEQKKQSGSTPTPTPTPTPIQLGPVAVLRAEIARRIEAAQGDAERANLSVSELMREVMDVFASVPTGSNDDAIDDAPENETQPSPVHVPLPVKEEPLRSTFTFKHE